jgi:DNA sulfur modification protein DndB
MVLDKAKTKEIFQDFEKEVYEILLKLDRRVEFYDVSVHYHRSHRFENQASIITDFEINVRTSSNEYLIILECKQHSDATGMIMKDLEGFVYKYNKIKQEYQSSKVIIKPLFLVAIESREDIPLSVGNEAMRHGIPCYGRLLIEQFSEAIDALSPDIAFSEFLHSYLGIDVSFEPPIISVKCVRNQNFETPTYSFSMPANELLRISHVNRANINKQDLNEAYQRAVKRKRLDEIATFVLDQQKKSKIEVFPNNIVANVKDAKFIEDPKDPNLGTLEFPNRYSSLWIIDGQHRLYSFCKITDQEIKKKYRFIVTTYPEISLSDQAEIFYVINDKQEGIDTDLIMFIQAQLLEKTKGYAAKVLLKIDKEEFFTKPLKKGFEEKEKGAWLRLSTLVIALTEEGLFDSEKSGGGLLQKNKEDLETPYRILREYIDYIRTHFKTSWNEGKKGFAQSNQGLAILFIILKKIIETKTKSKDGLDDIDVYSFKDFLDAIDSRDLDSKALIGRELRDIRSKTDRREVAKRLWDKVK